MPFIDCKDDMLISTNCSYDNLQTAESKCMKTLQFYVEQSRTYQENVEHPPSMKITQTWAYLVSWYYDP